jgi:N-acylneuraminate cytidylyltransferase
MKILGLIPARGGSKGIPRKNIKPLGGKPLIAYSIEAGLKSRYLDKVLVSTDDEEIAQVARQYGADVPFIRPAELARDDTPTLPVIQHALRFLADKGETYDAVCLLQPSSPFRTPAFIDAAIEKYVRSGADSLVTVRRVPHHFNPHWIFEPGKDGFLHIATGESNKNIIPRRQELPPAYYRDGSIYISDASLILYENALLGNRLAFLETPEDFPAINLDTRDDWEEAVRTIEKFKNAYL